MTIETEPNDARPFIPERPTLKSLREAAANCRAERKAFVEDLRLVAAAVR